VTCSDSRNDQAPVDPAGSGSSASAERAQLSYCPYCGQPNRHTSDCVAWEPPDKTVHTSGGPVNTSPRPFAVCFDCGETIVAESDEALNGAIYVHQQECEGVIL